MTSHTFPVTKSYLSEQAIARKIAIAYSLSDVRYQLLSATMRDVHIVTSSKAKNIFYIYRHGTRTEEEITAERCFVGYFLTITYQ